MKIEFVKIAAETNKKAVSYQARFVASELLTQDYSFIRKLPVVTSFQLFDRINSDHLSNQPQACRNTIIVRQNKDLFLREFRSVVYCSEHFYLINKMAACFGADSQHCNRTGRITGNVQRKWKYILE
jgi:hypothetical protein